MIAELGRLEDEACRAGASYETVNRSTGVRRVVTNATSLAARLQAIRTGRHTIEQLRLEPVTDAELEERFQAIRDQLPPIRYDGESEPLPAA